MAVMGLGVSMTMAAKDIRYLECGTHRAA
jgi:hypothetical protein